MSDLIRREDAARIAEDHNLDIWEYSTGNRSRIGHDPVAEAIRALPAVTVQAQIDAAREAALREVEAKLSSIDMRSCQFEWHPYTAGYIRSEFEKAIALIRKGDQP